jgi:hypothetical protein
MHCHETSAFRRIACGRALSSPTADARLGRASRRGAQSHDQSRPDRVDLAIKPPFACLDLADIGLLVNAPLAARLIFEMLERAGEIELSAIEP